jgi:protein involved in polysaccharide export with SLBB domain
MLTFDFPRGRHARSIALFALACSVIQVSAGGTVAHAQTQVTQSNAAANTAAPRAMPRPAPGGPTTAAIPPSTGETAAAPNVTSHEMSMVRSADRVLIKFQGFTNLTGEYRVSEDSMISIPGIGRIDISRLNLPEMERQLSEDMLRITGREAHVTAEIVEYKPIFVTGYVSRAGAYPWKPGMMVLHAETLSGGVFRPQESQSGVASDVERSRFEKVMVDLTRMLASRARLIAEQTNAATIETPRRLLEFSSKVEVTEIMNAQRAVMDARRTAFETRVETLKRGSTLADEELRGLKAQRERVEQQLAARRSMQKRVDTLYEKGHARYERSIDEMARTMEVEERLTNTILAISRIQSQQVGFQRDIEQSRQEFVASIESELLRHEREITQLEIDLESARSSYQRLTGQDAMLQNNKRATETKYEVVRHDSGQPRTLLADRLTQLRPGDILVVSLQDIGTR